VTMQQDNNAASAAAGNIKQCARVKLSFVGMFFFYLPGQLRKGVDRATNSPVGYDVCVSVCAFVITRAFLHGQYSRPLNNPPVTMLF
jgi:hypothetical protein